MVEISEIVRGYVPEPVIVGFCRTPFGKYRGGLSHLKATELGSKAIRGLLGSLEIDPRSGVIDGVYMGMVLQAGAGQAPARQASLGAGLPYSTPATTLNKVCGSSLKSVMIAAMEIESGRSDVIIAGGMESMSNAPMIAMDVSGGETVEYSSLASILHLDGLTDAFTGDSMGISGETIAKEEGVTRISADSYSLASHARASESWFNGWTKREITPIGDLNRDEGVRDSPSMEALSKLKPVFVEGGIVTAGNSSQVSDGAAALLICSRKAANEHGWPILGSIVDFETSGVEPSRVMSAPIPCIEELLSRAGLSSNDVDLYEHNEAFATASCAIKGHFQIPDDKFNIQGGAIAIGHPLGASGARCLMSLLSSMERTGGSLGIVTLCLGGGNAVGMLVSRAEN